MSDIKNKLKDLVESTMIPEVEHYVEDLHSLLEKGVETQDDLDAIKEMESFLVELQNILAVIEEDSMPHEEYERIYEKIMSNIKEHEH
ncbi:hypothetical protein ACH5BF_06940 [Arcobacter sp. YIC-464]|uniref:hypothetical protein n=1 Tax=Arcobacter sp. YIC-464 TaxID=3376631 RepID=UPI003C139D5C